MVDENKNACQILAELGLAEDSAEVKQQIAEIVIKLSKGRVVSHLRARCFDVTGEPKQASDKKVLLEWLVRQSGIGVKQRGISWVLESHVEPENSAFSILHRLKLLGPDKYKAALKAAGWSSRSDTITSIFTGLTRPDLTSKKTLERLKKAEDFAKSTDFAAYFDTYLASHKDGKKIAANQRKTERAIEFLRGQRAEMASAKRAIDGVVL